MVCPVTTTARCWRSNFSLVWLNFVTYKLGIMLPYLWKVLRSSAVIVPTLQKSIITIVNFPFLLGCFVLNRPILWMHLCIFLSSTTPIFPHQVVGEQRSDGNCGALCVDSHGLPFPHSLQWVGGHMDNGELGDGALTKPLHICEQLVWKTWVSPTHEA